MSLLLVEELTPKLRCRRPYAAPLLDCGEYPNQMLAGELLHRRVSLRAADSGRLR